MVGVYQHNEKAVNRKDTLIAHHTLIQLKMTWRIFEFGAKDGVPLVRANVDCLSMYPESAEMLTHWTAGL